MPRETIASWGMCHLRASRGICDIYHFFVAICLHFYFFVRFWSIFGGFDRRLLFGDFKIEGFEIVPKMVDFGHFWPLNRRPVLSFADFLMVRDPSVHLYALGGLNGQNWPKLAIFEI